MMTRYTLDAIRTAMNPHSTIPMIVVKKVKNRIDLLFNLSFHVPFGFGAKVYLSPVTWLDTEYPRKNAVMIAVVSPAIMISMLI